MSDPPLPHDERFENALTALIQTAHDNDVDVEGGWKCTIDGNGHSHWDVQITSVEYEE